MAAEAGAFANPTAGKAGASVNVAQASASAAIVKDVIEAKSTAEFSKAGASIGYSPLTGQLVNAQASAVVGKAGVGITNTPLQAHVSVGEAGREAGVGWQYTGANIGASLAEAKAGPFAARAGVKFGGGIRRRRMFVTSQFVTSAQFVTNSQIVTISFKIVTGMIVTNL